MSDKGGFHYLEGDGVEKPCMVLGKRSFTSSGKLVRFLGKPNKVLAKS